MSDEQNLTLLQQAQAQARKEATLSLGVTTEDGKSGEAHIAAQTRWKRLTAAIYAKVLLVRGKKPTTAAGVDVEIDMK
ncbi:hypothetical protein UFOVP1601_34 [uncultured Caudovirales phage]|uniref:Uncharacterized protein n=1 Tax=uncultured Caudovirales phage TaxID=2100421 RepID=A0A6J5SV92_9CAUD|nr:hypothetical protein UFOVP1154_44 [uncultured Caudovirales phage]CAB4200610.1 hypothetical protein UFOVP1341_49 [uncultured Caudovirales phage]CAB4218704.1 hypothetical protein UFOVP1601_34 [uncultured Caudovirales phage]